MDIKLTLFNVGYCLKDIKCAQFTSDLKCLAILSKEGQFDVYLLRPVTLRKQVASGVTSFQWHKDSANETAWRKFVTITADEICFYSINVINSECSDLLQCIHKIRFDGLQQLVGNREWVFGDIACVKIISFEDNLCMICIDTCIAHFHVANTGIELKSLCKIVVQKGDVGELVQSTDSFVYSFLAAEDILYVYDKESGRQTAAVNLITFIDNCVRHSTISLDKLVTYAISEDDRWLVLVGYEKEVFCVDLNKICHGSTVFANGLDNLEITNNALEKSSPNLIKESTSHACAEDLCERFLPFWMRSRRRVSRDITGFRKRLSTSTNFGEDSIDPHHCIAISTTSPVRNITVCSSILSVWTHELTEEFSELLIFDLPTGSLASSLRFQNPTHVILSNKCNLPHILIDNSHLSAFSYMFPQEEIVSQFLLYVNAAAADHLAHLNSWDCISMPLNILELGLKNRQLDAISFFLKTHDDDITVPEKSELKVTHLETVLSLLVTSIKECSQERGSQNFAEQLLHLTLNYLNRVLRIAVTPLEASLIEDEPNFEPKTSERIVEVVFDYLIKLRSFLKDYPKPSAHFTNIDNICYIQSQLNDFPLVLDAWTTWSKLPRKEIIEDAVWNRCLPLAHYFCINQSRSTNHDMLSFNQCWHIILDSTVECWRGGDMPRAMALLENFGLNVSDSLKTLMFNTADASLRMSIEVELKKQCVLSKPEEQVIQFFNIVEQMYPWHSFSKAKEMQIAVLLQRVDYWEEVFLSPFSSSSASYSYSASSELISSILDQVCISECDSWRSLDYGCLLLDWTTTWSQEIQERITSEGILIRNDSDLPKNYPSTVAFWYYLLQHSHWHHLRNLIKGSFSTECGMYKMPLWSDFSSLLNDVGLHAVPHIANCVLDELARYGIIACCEIEDFILCVKRLGKCGVNKTQLSACLSLPHASLTFEEFLKKFAVLCVDYLLPHVLYDHMEQFRAVNKLLYNDETLENSSWFKMMFQFKKWMLRPAECEAAFQASLHDVEYNLKHRCAMSADILHDEDLVTELATTLYSPVDSNMIDQEILKLCQSFNTDAALCVGFCVRCFEHVSLRQDITVYQLLQGRIFYDVEHLFGWQISSNLNDLNVSEELPYFSHPSLVKQHGVLQSLDFILYIKQGRPSFAYTKFVVHCAQNFGTVPSRQIQDVCNQVHSIALQHFYSKSITSASVAFMKMLNCNTEGLRIDLEASQLILTHCNFQISKLMSGQKKDVALKTNQDNIALLLRGSVLGQRRSLLKMLQLIEESIIAKLKAEGIECVSVEASCRWSMVVRFCKRYNLPLTATFLKLCIQAGDWLMFIFFADMHKYPKYQILNLSACYPNKHMVQHLKNAFAQSYSSGVSVTKLDERNKPRDVRASLYSKIGVKTSRKTERENSLQSSNASDDDAEDSASITKSSDDLTDNSGISSLIGCEPIQGFVEDLPSGLLGAIFYCHQQSNSWQCLLNSAIILKNPTLAMIAACYEDASVLSCMCVWLLIKSGKQLGETMPLETHQAFCFNKWNSEDLQLIIAKLIHLKQLHILTEGFCYFYPDCLLYPLLRFAKGFLLDKAYETSLVFFAEFQSKLKNMTYAHSCDISTNEQLKQIAVLVNNESFLGLSNPFERLQFLKAIFDSSMFHALTAVDNLPDYHMLYYMHQLLSSTSVSYNVNNLLKPKQDLCNAEECLTVLHRLLQDRQISVAFKFAEISQLPKSTVLLFQMQEELSMLEICPSSNNLHTKLSIWKHCFEIFKENNVPMIDICKFCKAMVHSYQPSEKYFVLYLSWLLTNPMQPNCSLGSDYDEELEREMWLSRIQAELENEDAGIMDIGEVFAELNAFQQHIAPTFAITPKTSQFIIQAATNGLKFKQNEWFLNNEKEKIVLGKIICQELDKGQIAIAYRLAQLFQQDCDALSIILTCMKLAEGVMTLNEIDAHLRLLLDQGSLVTTQALPNRPPNPVLTRNSSSGYSLSSLSGVLNSYDDMAKTKSLNMSSVEKVANRENDVLVTIEKLFSLCEAGDLFCFSIITLYRIAQVLNVEYIEIVDNWNDERLLKALLQCDAMGRFTLAKDYILSYGVCEEFIVSFLYNHIVYALRMFTGNPGTEGQFLCSSSELILKPTDTSVMFLHLAKLCRDPSLLGFRFLAGPFQEKVHLPLEVELCIRAHSCFALACHVEGIAHALQKARALSKQLVDASEFSLMVSLLVGIGRFSEMSYIFDILQENHQFELLFRKGMEKVPNLKMALLDYMRRFHPFDNEALTMIALHFRMYREIAEMLEVAAKKQINQFSFNRPVDLVKTLEMLENSMQFFADAAESYTKADCIQHAVLCMKQAELIALQIRLLPMENFILKCSVAQVSEFIINHQSVYEALIVAEAYDQHQDWVQALYVNFLMRNNLDYLRDFCHIIGLSTCIIEEIVTRYKKDDNKTIQMASNLLQLLHCLEDVQVKYELVNELEFHDLARKMLLEENAHILEDYVQSCPTLDPNMYNVHLICHTHDDVGWLKTVDQYYYGDRNDIQNAGVQYILDTVVEELEKDPNRRFIYVESSFFWRWWNSRDDTVHQRVQQLVQSGQLEFIGGGWCMNDEAAVYYVDTIDQMTWGFRLLNDTFGSCAVPKVAWQIDPFGHSREVASLFAQMGFDGLFFGRLDHDDKTTRQLSKTMELLWNASANLGIDGQLFTGVLPNLYQPPSGFCFDITCSDEPIKDNPNLKDYNVDTRVDEFLNEVSQQARYYATNHTAFTMGSDFQYQDAATWFVNLDKIVQYVNARQSQGSRVNVVYSTPSCYLQALNKANVVWSVKTDDFFPYASDDHSYWTGYFTSRPAFKGYTKDTNNILQIGKQLSTYANLLAESSEHLDPLRRYQGDAQHHDAITGTAKQHVNDDYTESLALGVSHAQMAINMAYEKLLPIATMTPPAQQFCNHLNVSYCDATENQNSFVVTVYNALAHNIHSHVRVPVTSSTYVVTGPDGTPVESQIVPIPQPVMVNPEKKGSAANELVFVVDIPANGFSSYFVEGSSSVKYEVSEELPRADDLIIQNEFLSVAVDGSTGLLKSITDLSTQKSYNIQQNFYYYPGMAGDNRLSQTRASGAYIFRPNGTTPLVIGATANTTIYTGAAVQEIQQTFSNYASQVIRLYPGQTNVELEWLIGPVPVDDVVGKEIITRYDTNLASDSRYYTDANGREVLERIRNYRETWDVNIKEPVSGNYYPINSRIYIKDEAQDSQLTVITDRSHGGGSIQDGSIEIMLHRRLLYDDAFGVGEPLDEPGIDGKGLTVRGKHYLLVGSVATSARAHRLLGGTASFPPYVSIASLSTTVDDWKQNFKTTFSGLSAPLPDNVNLVTLEPWKDGSVLLRLEHFFEKTDDPEDLSAPVTVNLQNLFSDFQILEATETTLGANVLLADGHRMMWNAESVSGKIDQSSTGKGLGDSFDVTLNPMQIRTFIVKIAFN